MHDIYGLAILIHPTGNCILVEAVDAVLNDESFSIPSPNTHLVCKLAEILSKWIKSNQIEVKIFEDNLVASLDNCIPTENLSHKVTRERIWSNYHVLRTSDDYISDWETFLQKAGATEFSPIFYQYVGDYIFKQLITSKYPVSDKAGEEISKTLTYPEMNGLRYAAGFVPRSLRKKLAKSTHPLKKDLLICLSQLEETDYVNVDDSQDWLNEIDRGGLIHVKNDVYELFMEIEKELRNHLRSNSPPSFTEQMKESISQAANVQFLWYLTSGDWEESSANAFLGMVIDEYLTMRGHSYASAWVEHYKAEHKKTTQKSRKQLVPGPT